MKAFVFKHITDYECGEEMTVVFAKTPEDARRFVLGAGRLDILYPPHAWRQDCGEMEQVEISEGRIISCPLRDEDTWDRGVACMASNEQMEQTEQKEKINEAAIKVESLKYTITSRSRQLAKMTRKIDRHKDDPGFARRVKKWRGEIDHLNTLIAAAVAAMPEAMTRLEGVSAPNSIDDDEMSSETSESEEELDNEQ